MDQSLLTESLSLIHRRWPSVHKQLLNYLTPTLNCISEENTLIINNIQLTSNYDRIAEAKLQISRIADNSTKVFVYGPALGDCCRELTTSTKLQQLNVVILNAEVFLLALNALDQTSWLNDPRVELHFLDHINEVYSPFIANPSELILVQDECAQLSDRISLELNHNYTQQRHITSSTNTDIKNLNFVEQDPDIKYLPFKNTTAKNRKIFIAAAGPTLETHINWLQKERPFLIAVDASVNTLVSNGIIPDIIMSIDRNSRHLFTDRNLTELINTALVYFPDVDTKLLQDWLGPRYSSYSDTPMYKNMPKHIKRSTLYSAGSVIHPAIDLAKKLMAKEIYLLGADFSFTMNKSHAATNEIKLQQSLDTATHWVLNNLGHKVPTLANLKGYLRELERYIANNKQIKFYNGSELGAHIMGTLQWKK